MDVVESIKKIISDAITGDQRRAVLDLAIKEIDLLRKRIESLEKALASKLPTCPYCGANGWRLVSSIPDPMMGVVGVRLIDLRCDACGKGHQEKRQPN